jgi:uncharacterized short protein YbdD (DUF466 family)
MKLRAAVVACAKNLAWYVRGVMGDDAYEKYLAHHAQVEPDHGHPHDGIGGGEPVMTEREFWRDQTDRQDTNPQGRCC